MCCCHYLVNSYDYYWHLLRSNVRYWQELLIIITGCLSFISYLIHITNNDVAIGGKMVVYLCGPLFFITCLWYCCKQFEWAIIQKYFFTQAHPLILLLCIIFLMIIEIVVAYRIYDNPISEIIFSIFFSFAIFVFLGMETTQNVSLILYIFYPLAICAASAINIVRSFYWETITIHKGNIHHFSFAQIDRLLQAQICLSTFIAFLYALNNPSRKYYILLVKHTSRFNIVHESTRYESLKKVSLILQFLWVLISITMLIYQYTRADVKYYIMDCCMIIIIFLNTLLLIHIEFDWKVLNRLLLSQNSLVLITCMMALLFSSTLVLQHVITYDFVLVSLNEYFWNLCIIYMVLIDGFRNARWWYRFVVYAIFVFKSVTLIARTIFDWIDSTFYPESKNWFTSNPKQTALIDNINRFAWFFVGGIALISLFHVVYDPGHSWFTMCVEKLCRDEHSGLKSVGSQLFNQSPGMTPNSHRDYKRKLTNTRNSVIQSTGGLTVEVEDDTSSVHFSLGTNVTNNPSDYGYKTLLKMDL